MIKEEITPKEIEEAQEIKDKLSKSTTFEMNWGQGPKSVRVVSCRISKGVDLESTYAVLNVEPIVATPYLPRIPGEVYIGWGGLQKGTASWCTGEDELIVDQDPRKANKTVSISFVGEDEAAVMWLARKILHAAGYQFRSHKTIRSTSQDEEDVFEYEYQRE